MEVYIGNLEPKITYGDLISFLKGFSSKAKIRIIEKRQSDGSKIRYGIAAFDSDKLALKAIRKLNNKPLRGERVIVREYFHRYYANERRDLNWRDKPWSGVERRRQERRKQHNLPPERSNAPGKQPANKTNEGFKQPRISAYTHLAKKG